MTTTHLWNSHLSPSYPSEKTPTHKDAQELASEKSWSVCR